MGVDLVGVDLVGVDLVGVDLVGMNPSLGVFSCAKLTSTFSQAPLQLKAGEELEKRTSTPLCRIKGPKFESCIITSMIDFLLTSPPFERPHLSDQVGCFPQQCPKTFGNEVLSL